MNTMRFIKRFLISGFLLSAATSALAADVGVSISVGQPGFYGRIDIGDYPYPRPRLIYERPIIIHRHADFYEPLYLRVPPGHAKNWGRYCGRYDACDRPVYFVQDSWYEREYAPMYRERHRDGYHNDYYEHRGNDGRNNREDRRHDNDRWDDRGRGNDHGNGHGRGHGRD